MDSFKSLKDHVYQYISGKISDGSLQPETKISEKMVVDDLKISRTPVREAMIQLAAEGYLENIPRRGFMVKQVDRTKAREVYSLLGVLEGYAASQAVENMTKKDLSTMRTLHTRMTAALESDDMQAYYSLQHQFHEIYIQKSGNQELARVIGQLKKIFIRQAYATGNGQSDLKQDLKSTNEEHRRMIDLFEKQSAQQLEHLLRVQHWDPKNADYDVL